MLKFITGRHVDVMYKVCFNKHSKEIELLQPLLSGAIICCLVIKTQEAHMHRRFQSTSNFTSDNPAAGCHTNKPFIIIITHRTNN